MYKSRNRQTVERFVRLVNDYAKTEHEIEFYASQLCMTAHYLGMVVKKETGITAKEYRIRPFFSWGHSGSRSKWIEAGVLSA